MAPDTARTQFECRHASLDCAMRSSNSCYAAHLLTMTALQLR